MPITITNNLVEQIATVVYEAHRGLGLTAGEIDIPTYQIIPGEKKDGYRKAVQMLLSNPEMTAFDLYSAIKSQNKPWLSLTRLERLPYEIFVSIVAAFRRV
jgi:peptide deformylase